MILTEGCIKSTGSMSALSEAISSVSASISRWTLDPERWRAFFWLSMKKIEDSPARMRSKALVLCVRSDSTQFRLWPDEHHSSTEHIFVRCVTACYVANSVLSVTHQFYYMKWKQILLLVEPKFYRYYLFSVTPSTSVRNVAGCGVWIWFLSILPFS